jgi:hypothetical protein
MGFAGLNPAPPNLHFSASEPMLREQDSHEQLSHKRAEEQAGEAVNGRSKGQIELRRITVEHRRGNLMTRASAILDDIIPQAAQRSR